MKTEKGLIYIPKRIEDSISNFCVDRDGALCKMLMVFSQAGMEEGMYYVKYKKLNV